MNPTLRATYSDGVFKPSNPVDLEDGTKVVISVVKRLEKRSKSAGLRSSFGGWKDIVDCDQLIEEIYRYRSRASNS